MRHSAAFVNHPSAHSVVDCEERGGSNPWQA
jgi:hypothetical protein